MAKSRIKLYRFEMKEINDFSYILNILTTIIVKLNSLLSISWASSMFPTEMVCPYCRIDYHTFYTMEFCNDITLIDV